MNNQRIEELANKLAFSLIDVSLGKDEEEKAYKTIIKKNRKPDNLRKTCPRSRNIMVIGAGASHAANKEIPLGSTVIEKMKEFYSQNNDIVKNLIENELNRLSKINKLDKSDFETNLLALSKLFGNDIRKNIQYYYNHRYYPNLFFEIAAHIFKHKFIDVIINFNFDELLDQVILEEMASSEFFYIYSDGHCPTNFEELLHRNIIKKPVYIKPHGTASHPSTLRFTREDYFFLPTDINNLIRRLIQGETSLEEQKNIPVNLIVVGFGMQSLEFNEILRDSLPNESCIYFFDIDKNIRKKIDAEIAKKNLHCSVFQVKNSCSLDKWGVRLWSKIRANFEPKYSPKDISRHLLINLVFSSGKTEIRKPDENIQYFFDRIYLEICITVISSKGLVTLEHLTNNRVGIYYSELKKQGLKNGTAIKPLQQFCKDLGLKLYKNWIEAYWIDITDADRFNHQKLISYLFNNLIKVLSKASQGSISSHQKDFIRYCNQIYKSNLISINPIYKLIHNNIFEHLEEDSIIDTNLVWSYRFRQVVTESEEKYKWDIVLVISDNGGVITNVHNKEYLIGKKIGLITASEEKDQDFNDFKFVGGKKFTLPWWLHTKHMVIFIKEFPLCKVSNRWEENWDPVRALFFTDNKGGNVNPVYLRDKDDIRKLIRMFGRYLIRAERAEKEINIPVNDDMNFADEILNNLSKNCLEKIAMI